MMNPRVSGTKNTNHIFFDLETYEPTSRPIGVNAISIPILNMARPTIKRTEPIVNNP